MHKPAAEPPRFSPFWICLLVFTALAVDSGKRFYEMMSQRKQMAATPLAQTDNVTRLTQLIAQREQVEPRLQQLSIDLLQIAQTNAVARQIVQEFNIQWSPPPAPAAASKP